MHHSVGASPAPPAPAPTAVPRPSGAALPGHFAAGSHEALGVELEEGLSEEGAQGLVERGRADAQRELAPGLESLDLGDLVVEGEEPMLQERPGILAR